MVEVFKRSDRKTRNHTRNLLLVAGAVLTELAFISPASAQYSFSPSNADELGGGVKVFGSAKDDRGALLPGVTIKLPNTGLLVTDDQGRYRMTLDQILTADALAVGCSKPGYQLVRVVKRAGPAGAAKPTIEADCILRKAQ